MVAEIKHAKDSVDSMVGGFRDAVVDLADWGEHEVEPAVEHSAERVTEKAHALGDDVREGAVTASPSAYRQVDEAARTATQEVERAKKTLSHAAAATTDHVATRPLTSMLLVALSGFLLGILVAWRRAGPHGG